MAHLSGGIASMLGRIRSYQDKDFWGTKGNPRHGTNPKQDFDYYINNNLIFDTAGFAGAISSVKTGVVEIPAARIVFATDYPQEIRARETVRDFVRDMRALGKDGETILSGNIASCSRRRLAHIVWMHRSTQSCAEGSCAFQNRTARPLTRARCFSISCTGIFTKSLSTSACSALRRSWE